VNHLILEILHVTFKHKTKIFWIFLGIFGAVALGLLLRPDLYRAPGRLMITGQRAYFRLAPGDARQSSTAPSLQDINTEIETIKGAAFLNKVIASLPFSLLDNDENATNNQEEQGFIGRTVGLLSSTAKAITSLPSTLKKMISSAIVSSSDTSGDSSNPLAGIPSPNPALSVLRSRLEVIAVPNSQLVEVAFTDNNPKRAAAVVNAILETYPLHQASLYQDPIALAFYDKQKEQFKQEITDLETQLKDLETRENLVGVPQQKDQALDLIEKMRDRLKGTDLDIQQGLGKIAKIEKELPSQPETVMQGRELIDPASKLLEERFTTLEIEKNELLQKYTDKDRRVQDKISEIASIREKITSSPKTQIVVGERIAPNPVRVDLLKELSDQKVKLGQLYPKQETLARQITEMQNDLDQLNLKGYEVQHLQEMLTNKKESYALYSKKAEEARISGAMDQENLVNVKVTDRALAPAMPMGGNAAILLVLAAIIGAGAGVGGVLTLEYIRPTFHSEIDVERHLQLPVLALIPDLREEA
jgi:uncharacterized protein involved in exopolysaccharide biosynthesis